MLKIGNILWTFYGNDYFVGEISDSSIVCTGFSSKEQFYFIGTNGIIGGDQRMFIPVTANLNTLAKISDYLDPVYCTISESVAVNYIKDHFNETDNQRDIQQDASKQL